jgi:serine/threonine-protein kinase HipA
MTSPPEDLKLLRAVDQADVYKAGQRAATLTRTPDGVEFRYLEAWKLEAKPAIASTLPVSAESINRPGGALPSYFSGLLPEGRRLGALRRAVKTSADDELTLLLAVGTDAVGDVQVVPTGVMPYEVPPRLAIEDIGKASFAELLEELDIRPQRTALPGVQDKTSAAMINLPLARAGERFVLKLNRVGGYPYLVENEAFFLAAARTAKLNVPDFQLVTDRDGASGLLVRRFDRATVDGCPIALAVEDGCQAADRPPADKYRLGSDRTFAALATICDAPSVAAREFIRQLAFAYLTGNGDAHAKNFSVVRDAAGEWRASPAYDVPSSYPYGDTTLALQLGDRSTGDFRLSDFVALGQRLGVPQRATERAIAELVDRSGAWIDALDQLPFDSGKVRKLFRVLVRRRDLLSSHDR